MAAKRKHRDLMPALLSELSKGPKSTPVIGRLLGISNRLTYSLCRRAEDAGLVGSELGDSPGLYCLDCEKAVTKETYTSCHEDGHEIRTMRIKTRTWFLTSTAKTPTKRSR